MRTVTGFLLGLLFGAGLVIGGMSDPAKVLNFLDVAGIGAGTWDPSLAFVLAGATGTTLVGYRLIRRPAPVLGGTFDAPPTTGIDRRLIGGAALFGLGWGIGGFCPGPAWTALPLLSPGTLAFLPAMIAGMALVAIVDRRERGG